MAPKTKVLTATTPEDNGYDPRCGSYDPCYSGDLDEFDKEFEERDAKVDATRAGFAHQDKPNKPAAWDD
jgi:hypothetical protein